MRAPGLQRLIDERAHAIATEVAKQAVKEGIWSAVHRIVRKELTARTRIVAGQLGSIERRLHRLEFYTGVNLAEKNHAGRPIPPKVRKRRAR